MLFMKIFYSILFLIFTSTIAFAQTSPMSNSEMIEKARQIAAQEKYETELKNRRLQHKDSIDYTLDDGVMSKEEMQQEAEYIFGLCSQNAYQRLYFDCKCLSGAFLLERERLGPTAMQSIILQNLTQSNNAKCANVESAANESYKSCMGYSKTYRKFETDHEELCTCTANRAATNFGKKPWLESSYIRSLNTAALMHCMKPENRATDKAEKEELKKRKAETVKTSPPQ